MSGIFLNNNIKNVFDSVSESSVKLPQWITIVDNANNTEMSATSSMMPNMMNNVSATSSMMRQSGGNTSATSSMVMNHVGDLSATSTMNQSRGKFSATSPMGLNQAGGAFSATSHNNASEQDVNKLISMLTSESSSANMNGMSETSTVSLEAQLRDILNQEGGAKKKKSKKQVGGSLNVDDVKNFFMDLKSQGVNVNVKLNDKTMSDFFGGADITSTELAQSSVLNMSSTSEVNPAELVGGAKKKKGSKKSSKKASKKSSMKGGAKKGSKKASKKSSKKASKKSSKKASKKGSKSSQDGGNNPGFMAFQELRKHIATKLGVSNGPKAGKVAGAVNKDMKEKHPGLSAVEISKKAIEHFDKNVEHYKQMLPK